MEVPFFSPLFICVHFNVYINLQQAAFSNIKSFSMDLIKVFELNSNTNILEISSSSYLCLDLFVIFSLESSSKLLNALFLILLLQAILYIRRLHLSGTLIKRRKEGNHMGTQNMSIILMALWFDCPDNCIQTFDFVNFLQ